MMRSLTDPKVESIDSRMLPGIGQAILLGPELKRPREHYNLGKHSYIPKLSAARKSRTNKMQHIKVFLATKGKHGRHEAACPISTCIMALRRGVRAATPMTWCLGDADNRTVIHIEGI